jgi:hypothetical protein
MTSWLVAAAVATSACAQPTHFSPNERSVKGHYVITPVTAALQRSMLKRLSRASFQPVSIHFARAITRDRIIRPGRNYYLTKAAWFSDAAPGTVPGKWIQIGVDVDSNGVAYITSNLLTHARGTSEFAAILTSSVRLRGIVPLCGAAE